MSTVMTARVLQICILKAEVCTSHALNMSFSFLVQDNDVNQVSNVEVLWNMTAINILPLHLYPFSFCLYTVNSQF